MGLLPWDDWFYNLSYRRNEINALHSEAVSLQDLVQSQVIQFNTHLQQYQAMVASNEALVIIANVIQMKDQKFKDYQVSLSALPPTAPGLVPLKVGEMISELAGGTLMVRGVVQFAKIAKNYMGDAGEAGGEAVGEDAAVELGDVAGEVGLDAVGEEAAEIGAEAVGEDVAEAAAEAAVEGASLGALAGTGIGIFAAVGIDMIFGAIDGAQEKAELDKQISNLEAAIAKVRGYYNTLEVKMGTIDEGLVKEETRFLSVMDGLAKVANEPPNFNVNIEPTVANFPKFLAAVTSALTQYGMYVKLRTDWVVAQERNPSITKEVFISGMMMLAPPDVTKEQLEHYWDVLAANSDTMRPTPLVT